MSDHVDSLGSSNESELSLSHEFSPFEGGSSGSEAAESEAVAMVEPNPLTATRAALQTLVKNQQVLRGFSTGI